jgi:predicted CXXCH cytochrome family protein
VTLRRAFSYNCERCHGPARSPALLFVAARELCAECYPLPEAPPPTPWRAAVAALLGGVVAGVSVVAWAMGGRWW